MRLHIGGNMWERVGITGKKDVWRVGSGNEMLNCWGWVGFMVGSPVSSFQFRDTPSMLAPRTVRGSGVRDQGLGEGNCGWVSACLVPGMLTRPDTAGACKHGTLQCPPYRTGALAGLGESVVQWCERVQQMGLMTYSTSCGGQCPPYGTRPGGAEDERNSIVRSIDDVPRIRPPSPLPGREEGGMKAFHGLRVPACGGRAPPVATAHDPSGIKSACSSTHAVFAPILPRSRGVPRSGLLGRSLRGWYNNPHIPIGITARFNGLHDSTLLQV